MARSEEFQKVAGYNAQSTPSSLKRVLEARIARLQSQTGCWQELDRQFEASGIYIKRAYPQIAAQKLYDYAREELCPYKPYIKSDEDGNLIDDQGRKIDKKDAPKDEGYFRTILYWMVSSPWHENEKSLSDIEGTNPVWKPEDWAKIQVDLFLYSKLKERKNIKDIQRNVREIKNPKALEGQISKYQVFNARANRLMDKADALFSGKTDEAEVVFTSSEKMIDADGIERPRLRVIHLKSEAASRAYGRDTRWCTAYQDKPTQFEYYSENLLLFHSSDGRRAQLHYGSTKAELKDELDDDTTFHKLGISDVVSLSSLILERYMKDQNFDYKKFAFTLPLLDGCTDISRAIDKGFDQWSDDAFLQLISGLFCFRGKGREFVYSQMQDLADRLKVLEDFKGVVGNESFKLSFLKRVTDVFQTWSKDAGSTEIFTMIVQYSKIEDSQSFLKVCLGQLIVERLKNLGDFKNVGESELFGNLFSKCTADISQTWGDDIRAAEIFPVVVEYARIEDSQPFLKAYLGKLLYENIPLVLNAVFSIDPNKDSTAFIDIAKIDPVFKAKVLASMCDAVSELAMRWSTKELSQNVPAILGISRQDGEIYDVLRSAILKTAPAFAERTCQGNVWGAFAEFSNAIASLDAELNSLLEDMFDQTLALELPTSINKMMETKSRREVRKLIVALEANPKYAAVFHTLPSAYKTFVSTFSNGNDNALWLNAPLQYNVERGLDKALADKINNRADSIVNKYRQIEEALINQSTDREEITLAVVTLDNPHSLNGQEAPSSEGSGVADKESQATLRGLFGFATRGVRTLLKFTGIIKDGSNDNAPRP